MAWIVPRKRADGSRSFRVAWRDGIDGTAQSETFTDQRAAKAFLRDVEAAGNTWPQGWVPGSGYLPPSANPSGFTVRTAAIEAVRVNQKARESTRADYLREIDRYLPADDPLAAMFVEDVDDAAVAEWHLRLAAMPTLPGGTNTSQQTRLAGLRAAGETLGTLSPKTRAHAHARLSSALALMVRRGHIPRNVAIGHNPRVLPNPHAPALTPQEYAAFLPYIPERWQLFVDTLARTGLRFSEAAALTKRQVQLTHNPPSLLVDQAFKKKVERHRREIGPPKTRRGHRTVPIDADLTARLAAHTTGLRPNDYVFQTIAGNPLRHSYLHRIWRPAVFAAIDDGVLTFEATIHGLRHAHTTWLLLAGVPLHVVAARIGDDPATMLRNYSHIVSGADIVAADAITRTLSAAGTNTPQGDDDATGPTVDPWDAVQIRANIRAAGTIALPA